MTGRKSKLFIFPHAGGSAQYYVPFANAFTSDIKRIAVQYPGQRGIHDLGSFTGIPDLADRICQMLSPLDQSDGEVAFFGHSMGALLAFDVARRFEAAGSPIAALFVSACAAPGRIGYEYIPGSDRGLLNAVSEMTGVNPEFLQNEEFAAKILPTLRGLRAIANYECPPDAAISCPNLCVSGRRRRSRHLREGCAVVCAHDVRIHRAGVHRSSLLSQRAPNSACRRHRGQDLVVLQGLTAEPPLTSGDAQY